MGRGQTDTYSPPGNDKGNFILQGRLPTTNVVMALPFQVKESPVTLILL